MAWGEREAMTAINRGHSIEEDEHFDTQSLESNHNRIFKSSSNLTTSSSKLLGGQRRLSNKNSSSLWDDSRGVGVSYDHTGSFARGI